MVVGSEVFLSGRAAVRALAGLDDPQSQPGAGQQALFEGAGADIPEGALGLPVFIWGPEEEMDRLDAFLASREREAVTL